ncbi:hypothetical protein FYA86_01105 [Bordetella holmesii]|nr:hypothetical protein FYA86_01105 [Bordetella holmesii]
MNAQRLSRTQAQTEAGIMRVQVERILREAWLGIDAMVPLLQVGCDQARPVLSRTMSTRPYFRSLTLFDGRQAYCSSLPSLPGGHSREWPWAIPLDVGCGWSTGRLSCLSVPPCWPVLQARANGMRLQ